MYFKIATLSLGAILAIAPALAKDYLSILQSTEVKLERGVDVAQNQYRDRACPVQLTRATIDVCNAAYDVAIARTRESIAELKGMITKSTETHQAVTQSRAEASAAERALVQKIAELEDRALQQDLLALIPIGDYENYNQYNMDTVKFAERIEVIFKVGNTN